MNDKLYHLIFLMIMFLMIMFSFPSIGQVDLLKDINAGMRVPGIDGIEGNKAVYGDFVYYTGGDQVTGAELWRSDGTENGTSKVKDINPGKDPSYPSSLTVGNDILYFTADDGVHGRELWRTDGTATGTYMVADIYQGIGSSYPNELAFVNGVLYFNASHPQTGVELWSSDGTSAGTRMVADLNTAAGAGSYPEHITEYQDAAYFVADDGSPGVELWKTNGTSSGTVLVKDMYDSISDGVAPFMVVINSSIFFAVFNEKFFRAWTSDGTSEGTLPLNDVIISGSANHFPSKQQILGNYLYFSGSNGNSIEYELWRTDGTAAHTELVATINPNEGIGSQPLSIIAIDSTLYFVARASTSFENYDLFKSNGEVGNYTLIDGSFTVERPQFLTNFNGTLCFTAGESTHGLEFCTYKGDSVTLYDIAPGSTSSYPVNLVALPDVLLFTPARSHGGLWMYDGSSVARVGQKLHNSSDPSSFIHNGDNITYFVASDGVTGHELWRTDGTTSGTAMVKDINPSGSSTPSKFTMMGNTLFFVANDGVHGAELWKSDGTTEGTVMVTDIRPGASSSSPLHLTVLGNDLFFAASTGVGSSQLWKSAAGGPAVLVKQLPGMPLSMTALAPYVYFVGGTWQSEEILFTTQYTCGLWRSDGTEQGTVLISDDLASCSGDGTSSAQLIAMGSNLYFQGSITGLDNELMTYDGTNVSLVRDINPGGSSYPGNFTVVGDTLFFGANDGVHGYELWRTDGTPWNTVLVRDVNVGPAPSLYNAPSHPGPPFAPKAYMAAFSGKLYFRANDGLNGLELWTSDGSAVGTVMMNDISPGSSSSFPSDFQVADSLLYFVAKDTPGSLVSPFTTQIFVTNGSSCGTRKLSSSIPAIAPQFLTASGTKLYASMLSEGFGREPFVIDALLVDNAPADCGTPLPDLLVSNQRAAEAEELVSVTSEKAHTGAFPNPFSDNVTIPFTIQNENAFVQIIIYDAMGHRVAEVINATLQTGYHEASWDGTDSQGNKVRQGVYVYKLKSSDATGMVQGRLVAK